MATEKHSRALFFDGASKGNLGVAGAGGILLDPREQIEKTFAWGLGHKMNNKAEWMALMQGLDLTNTLTIPRLIVFRDSR